MLLYAVCMECRVTCKSIINTHSYPPHTHAPQVCQHIVDGWCSSLPPSGECSISSTQCQNAAPVDPTKEPLREGDYGHHGALSAVEVMVRVKAVMHMVMCMVNTR